MAVNPELLKILVCPLCKAPVNLTESGQGLKRLGYGADIKASARVDRFAFAPELRRDPLRVEVGTVGIVSSHWQK